LNVDADAAIAAASEALAAPKRLLTAPDA